MHVCVQYETNQVYEWVSASVMGTCSDWVLNSHYLVGGLYLDIEQFMIISMQNEN